MSVQPTIGLTVGDSLDRVSRLGGSYDFVEIGLPEGPLPEEFADPAAVRRAVETIDADLSIHLPFSQVLVTPVPVINEAIISYLDDLLSWASEAGAQKAILHGTSRNPHDLSLRPLFETQLERVNSRATAAGIELVVENVGHQKRGIQLSVLGEMAEATDTAVCFDLGHAFMEAKMDGVTRFLKRHGGLISHLHVHDVRSRGDTHLPVGAGEIDYETVAEYLDSFPGTIAIEVFTDDAALLADSAERIEAWLYHSNR